VLGRAEPRLLASGNVRQFERQPQRHVHAVRFLLRPDFYEQVRVAARIVRVTAAVMRVAFVIVMRIVVAGAMVVTAIARWLVVVTRMGGALRVIDLKVRVPIVVRADDPVTAHRQRNCHDAADPQQ
jgi:hypothetical protein